MRDPAVQVRSTKITAQAAVSNERTVPAEVPVALVYDGTTYAVMMASPSDLEDFALGFSLTEGVISAPEDIESLELIALDRGIELRMWLAPDRRRALADRRRSMAGPTGCGLCGVESLEAAVPTCPRVTAGLTVTAKDINEAIASLPEAQLLNQRTRAVHGAGFWTREKGLIALAEDVGRHNALDKLIGGLRRTRADLGDGVVLLTSRVSVEMVQKAAVSGAPIVVAFSAPTALALETAEAAGITLVAVARADAFEIFTHPHRIEGLELEQTKDKGLVAHAV
jgi:FdhD protein